MALGIGMGLTYGNSSASIGIDVITLLNAFKLRVAADGGNYEAEACQTSTLTNLNNI
jgi:hypothetical protein